MVTSKAASIILITSSIIHFISPQYFCHAKSIRTPSCSLQNGTVVVLVKAKIATQSYGGRSFWCAAASRWNVSHVAETQVKKIMLTINKLLTWKQMDELLMIYLIMFVSSFSSEVHYYLLYLKLIFILLYFFSLIISSRILFLYIIFISLNSYISTLARNRDSRAFIYKA